MSKKICVVGLGYIGLPTAIVFAENDWNVIGVDINQYIVDHLNNGRTTMKEKELQARLQAVISKDRFIAKLEPLEADVFIVAVPTPLNGDKQPNLTFVQDAIQSIIPVLRKGNTIIIESTIPPRTTRDVVGPLLKSANFRPGQDVYLAHCPERVLPGRIFHELYENNRIVGGINEQSAREAANVYRSFVKGKIIETISESAEMSKLMENTYRDVNIALANELTKVAEQLKINPLEVISLANEHPRVHIHAPGPGVGGHCLAIDPYFIVQKDPVHTKLIYEARQINESMPSFVVQQFRKLVEPSTKITVFGLAYKGNVDDVRESPAIEIVSELIAQGFHVNIYDPFVQQSQVPFVLSTYEESLQNSNGLLILTDHDEFKQMDWQKICHLMSNTVVLDTKNCVQNRPDIGSYYNFGSLHEINQI